jgi:hypothetical protein
MAIPAHCAVVATGMLRSLRDTRVTWCLPIPALTASITGLMAPLMIARTSPKLESSRFIAVSFQRRDTKQYSQHRFVGWDTALKFARWVANSPELELLKLDLES